VSAHDVVNSLFLLGVSMWLLSASVDNGCVEFDVVYPHCVSGSV
jgi:hypothetical protein